MVIKFPHKKGPKAKNQTETLSQTQSNSDASDDTHSCGDQAANTPVLVPDAHGVLVLCYAILIAIFLTRIGWKIR